MAVHHTGITAQAIALEEATYYLQQVFAQPPLPPQSDLHSTPLLQNVFDGSGLMPGCILPAAWQIRIDTVDWARFNVNRTLSFPSTLYLTVDVAVYCPDQYKALSDIQAIILFYAGPGAVPGKAGDLQTIDDMQYSHCDPPVFHENGNAFQRHFINAQFH